MELLAYLTVEHPLIIDADTRLAEYERQLAGLTRDGTNPSPAPTNDDRLRITVQEQTAETPAPPVHTPAAESKQPGAEESLRLEQALAKWESAQTDLEAALDRESAAADRFAALMARRATSQQKTADRQLTPEPAESHAAVTPPQAPSSGSATSGSQLLVLAALVIALAVAAVFSIKLARATDPSIFSGAEDAASALSLPVVGVIPTGSSLAVHGSLWNRHRSLAFLVQMLAAVAVFALVAFLVQNPCAIWQFVRAPLDAWR